MSALLFRCVVYFVVVALVMVVITAQAHNNARDTLRASVRPTLKWSAWSVVLVVTMQLMHWLFID